MLIFVAACKFFLYFSFFSSLIFLNDFSFSLSCLGLLRWLNIYIYIFIFIFQSNLGNFWLLQIFFPAVYCFPHSGIWRLVYQTFLYCPTGLSLFCFSLFLLLFCYSDWVISVFEFSDCFSLFPFCYWDVKWIFCCCRWFFFS